MKKLMLILIAAFSLGLVACEKKADDAKGEEAKTEEPKEEPAKEEPAKEEPKEGEQLAMVEVPKDGKKFEPPVKPEQIPAGAWYCDMGTVEYARMDKGDGKCPVCGMMLKEKKAGAAEADGAAGAADGHEGHDHDGNEGHDHDGNEGHDHDGHDH